METLFRPSLNCSAFSRAAHAAPVIDSANFFRAIHDSISKARHSVFILGWELDSGTRLLRGRDEAASEIPSVAVEFLTWCARRNPDLQLYLLRWDSSLAFIADREPMPEYAWTTDSPVNLHFCLDGTAPLGGSQHQKIILIDDELVFSGGMDIARQRWDEREHRPVEPERTDADGPYGPYHDAQVVIDGPIVGEFSRLVRWRWKRAAGYDAAPSRIPSPASPVPTWPSKFPPVMTDIPCAVALTIPAADDFEGAAHIKQMYFDLLERAEDFVYVENQFLAWVEFAQALNRRLKERPRLRALLLSTCKPSGVMEREGMWAARIDFKKALTEGISPDRVRMVCTAMKDDGDARHDKKIHSKIFVVDDKTLTVSSSNLAQRSMTVDSECDVVFAAENADHARAIRGIRNDLLSEHTGLALAELDRILAQPNPFPALMAARPRNCYGFRDIDDSAITDQTLMPVALAIADPDKPFLGGAEMPLRNPRRTAFLAALPVALLALVSYFALRSLTDGFDHDVIKGFISEARGTPWAFPAVLAAFVLGGFVLFPVTVLSLLTAAVFGPFWGPLYGLTGALTSAAVMFGLGHLAGLKGLRKILGDRIRSIDAQFSETGIIGVAVLRMIPIAPYSLVNLAAGISSVRFSDFMIGSLLGFLPFFIIKGFVGASIVDIILNPTAETVTILLFAIVGWIGLVLLSSFLARRWRKSRIA